MAALLSVTAVQGGEGWLAHNVRTSKSNGDVGKREAKVEFNS